MKTATPTTVTIATSELTALSQLDRALLSAINAAKKLGAQEYIRDLVFMKTTVDVKINKIVGEQ